MAADTLRSSKIISNVIPEKLSKNFDSKKSSENPLISARLRLIISEIDFSKGNFLIAADQSTKK